MTMREVPPVDTRVSLRGTIFIWVGVAAAAACALVLYFFNPSQSAFYPRCFFKMATGLDCPGCGGLRATHQLLHGHVREAFVLNPLFIAALPATALFLSRPLVEKLTGRKWFQNFSPTTGIWVCGVIVVAFGVLRNLPWRVWLAA
jgi:hypothetical protein